MPDSDPGCAEDRRVAFEHAAEILATAWRCHRLIQSDSALRQALIDDPLSLQLAYGRGGGPLGLSPYSEDATPPDSILRRFTPLFSGGDALAYTVEIAKSMDEGTARELFKKLDKLEAIPSSAACGESLAVSWSNENCGGSACVGLFIARPRIHGRNEWRTLFGIFFDRGDVERLRQMVAVAIGHRCSVSRIRVTGQVLQDALGQNDRSANAYKHWRK